MATYKLGDKTFVSTGDVNKDLAIIKQNFPEVDATALSQSLGQTSTEDPDQETFLQKLFKTSSGRQPQVSEQPLGERFVASFGNKEKKTPIPDSLQGLLSVGVPAYGLLTGGHVLGDIAQMSGNLPANLVELPATILESIPGGTRAKQGIGTLIGNYQAPQGQEDYLDNQEAMTNDVINLAAIFMPEIVSGVKTAKDTVKTLVNNGLSKTQNGFIGDLIRSGDDLARKTVENIPVLGGALEKRRLAKFDTNLRKVGPIKTNSKELAGLDAKEQIAGIGDDATRVYQEFQQGLLGRFGGDKHSFESVRRAINERINAIPDSLASGSREARRLRNELIQLRDAISKNPTLAEMDKFTKYFGDRANFKSSSRDAINRIYGEIYNASKQDMIQGFERSVIRAMERKQPYRKASATKDALLDEQNILAEKAAKNPLWVDSKSGASLVKQPNWAKRTGAEKVAATQEQNAAQLSEIQKLLKDLDSGNEELGRQAAQEILKRRADIHKNINVQEGEVGKLAELKAGEVVDRAISTGKLQRNINGLQDVLEANPAYKEPLRTILIAHIKDKANSPEALVKTLSQYQEVLPSLLTKEELETLQRLAGSYRRPIMKTPSNINVDIPYNIRAEIPFLQQLLLNSPTQK